MFIIIRSPYGFCANENVCKHVLTSNFEFYRSHNTMKNGGI